jgi:hypothetical protein
MDKEQCSYYVMGESLKSALSKANITEVEFYIEIDVTEYIDRPVETPDNLNVYGIEDTLPTCPYCHIGYLQQHEIFEEDVCCDYCGYDSYVEELAHMNEYFRDIYSDY